MRYPKSRLNKTTGSRSKALLLLALGSLALAAIATTGLTRSVDSKTTSSPAVGTDGFARRVRELSRRGATRSATGVAGVARGNSPAVPLVTITVDRTDDSASPAASLCTPAPNDCSLRGAIALANTIPGTTIILPAGTYQLTIDGSSETGFCFDQSVGDLDISGNNTSIVGAGASTTIIQQTQPHDRVFCVDANLDGNFNFNISGVTITGGKETFGVGGGGIVSGAGGDNTTIQDCIISGNTASGSGSPVGGGLGNAGGSLNVSGTTFDGNTSVGSGGGLYFGGAPGAGTLSVSNSTFNNNTSSGGNGGGMLATQGASYTVSGSSFTGNKSQGSNGQGGGIFNESGTMSVTTSSFSGNQVTSGTGKGGGIANSNSGILTANFNRIALNTAVTGSGASNNGGTANYNDNWWGCNGGPGSSGGCSSAANNVSGGSPVTWLQLRHSASPSTICTNGTSTLTADIKGRNAGAALTTELNGLPAFPVPPATIFSNAVLGSLSGASTQFVDGVATATYTAGNSAGSGSADATADNQTVTATVTIGANTTSALTNQTVCAGGTATFSTTASGPGPFTFVWKKGATVLNNGDLGGRVTITTGASTSSLSISNVQASDADTYTVEATGACSTAMQSATLTVNSPTSTSTPANQTVCQGTNASFSTTASGTGPFHYAWTVDGSPFDGDNSSISVSTGSLSVGNHTVSVTTTGACGSDTKNATLTVQENTSATTPADQTVCQGATANFSTTASGTGPFHYAWTVDGSSFNGDSSSINVPTGSLSVGNHPVTVTVTGACGSTTKSATLTVQENTSATTPADKTVCQGATAGFSTTASGTGPFHYAWTVDGSSFNGDSSSINVPTGLLSVGNHPVTVTVSGTCGSVTKSATLTVQENTSATTPADQTVCQGATASFSTTASGTGPFHYAWTVDGSPFNGDSSSINVPTGSLSIGSHAVSVTVSGTCGSVTKNATLTVQENTSATTPANQTVCQGATASFSTTASGTGPFHYAWTVDGSAFDGDSASINVPTGSLSVGNHSISVTVSGTCGSVVRNATLTVQANTSTTKPNDQTVCEGAGASFSTTASGTGPFTFVWKKGATVLHNGDLGGRVTITNTSTTSTLSISSTQGSDSGTYSVETTGTCGTAVQSANLTVNTSPPVITLNGNSINLSPPDHSYHTVSVTDLVASASSCDGTVNVNTVIIDHVTSDEAENADADGTTFNDIVINCDRKSVQLRAERAGNADGRVYTIYFKATDSFGHSTITTAKVTVNLSGPAVDSGPHYTVTNATCP
jgi:Immunoglobulin I-set domain